MPRSVWLLAISAFVIGALARELLPYQGTAAPAPAAGCWPARPHASGSVTASISSADGQRSYLLHVPPSYNGADAAPLVLAFHGLFGTSAWMETYTELSVRADRPDDGSIVVYPQGLSSGLGVPHFNNAQLPAPEPDDVAFISQLLDDLESQLCIDSDRVYATGYSNGAQMSARLACSLSDRIAAVGLVAGAYYPPEWEGVAETCTGTRAVSVIVLHGRVDTVIPFEGGGPLGVRLPIDNETPVEDVLQDWAAHDNCASGRLQSNVNDAVQLVQYDACDGGAAVQLYAIDSGGHAWPGSPYNGPPDDGSKGVIANDLILQFFRSHSLDGTALPDTDGDAIPDLYDPDNDNDGCRDTAELQTAPGSENTGGLRNPNNPWDYFNPSGDRRILIDDVALVLHRYGRQAGDPGYDQKYDRSFVGPRLWDLGPPDGKIDLLDILTVLAQYGDDCR